MSAKNITVKETVEIAASPEAVWDFTQDWSRRTEWDPAILKAEILESDPPTIRAEGSGRSRFLVRYKLYDKPKRTSLVMEPEGHGWLDGGGAWVYESSSGGTLWTQTNTLRIRGRLRAFFLAGLLRWQLGRFTRKAMRNAKERIEGSRALPSG